MAVSNVELVVNAVKAVNPLRLVNKESKKLQQAISYTQRTMSELGRVGERAGKAIRVTFDRAAKSAAALRKKLSGVRGALAGIGVSALTSRMINQAASFKQVEIRLSVLSKEYGEFSRIQELVSKNAKTFNQSQAESASNFADAYARLRPLGISLDQIQTVYEGFNATALASGTSAVAASGAFLQLSQALGSGRLQGDEFRSIAEQVPGILRLVADEMGVTVGALKQFGSEGKITSDILINALAKGFEQNKDKIQELLDLSPAQKFKNFNNAVSELSNSIGLELLPVITPLVDAGTETVEIFGRLPAPLKTATAALFGLGAGFTAAAAGANLLGISLTKAGLVKLAALSGKIALLAAPFLGLALAFEDAQRRKEALDKALESNSLNEVQDALNGSIQELNGLIDGLRIIEKTPYFKGQTAEIQRLKKQVEEAAAKVDELTRRRDLIIDLKVNVPFPNFDKMGQGFADELKDELEKLGLDYTPGKEVKPLKTKKTPTASKKTRGTGRDPADILADQIKAGDEILEQQNRKLELAEQDTKFQQQLLQIEYKRQDGAKRILQTTADFQQEQLLLRNDAIASDEMHAALISKVFDDTDKAVREQKRLLDIRQQAQDEFKAFFKDVLQKEAAKMNQIYASIGESIQTGIVDSLTAAVDGTKKLADVAADTLRSVANILLQFGVNTALGELSTVGGTGSIFDKLFGGFRASGGTVTGGRSYVVGEKGPELFTPGRTGSIAPSGSFGGANVVVNVDASGTQAQGNQPNAKLLGQAIGAAVQAELIKQKRPGGLLAV